MESEATKKADRFNGLKVGDRVQANGYPGTVVRLCEWSYSMVEVMLASGGVCVPASEVEK